jgi:DNA invertase Pin-like site-specific DNA recombinase
VTKAVAYLRTSSLTNIGAGKDSDKRQLAAIEAHAEAVGYELVRTYYDAAISGSDPVGDRPGFAAMLADLLANGARTIIVESPDRFARDLLVQLAGHDMLKAKGITLIAASAPTYFTEESPTAVLVRQVLGAVAEFERSTLVAKLAAARRRSGNLGGRKGIAALNPEATKLARDLQTEATARGDGLTLRTLSAQLAAAGHVSASGRPFEASVVAEMLRVGPNLTEHD